MIYRNKQGQIGLVISHEYNHRGDGKPYKFRGIGLRGGVWYSKEVPTYVASSIEDYCNRRDEIRRQYKRATEE